MRVQQEPAGQHGRDRARRPEHRRARARVRGDRQPQRGETAEDVERHEAHRADRAFQRCSEAGEAGHIEQERERVGVQEERRERGLPDRGLGGDGAADARLPAAQHGLREAGRGERAVAPQVGELVGDRPVGDQRPVRRTEHDRAPGADRERVGDHVGGEQWDFSNILSADPWCQPPAWRNIPGV